MGAAGRAFVTSFLATMTLLLVLLAVAMLGYVYIAINLPAPEELASRSATFVSTKIYDRNGVVLYEVFDPHGGRRTLVPLDRISPYLIQATIATEDANFYQHPGIDPVGLTRAIVRNVRAGEIEAGGSTIPQQLVKMVFLSPERTMTRKVKEAVLAAEVTRRYSKDQILEIYLNEIFYGNLAYGAEAAAQTYFGKPAEELTLAEAALLAGIPQSPALYDPFTNPEDTLWRREQVLRLMVNNGYITQAEANAANAEPLPRTSQPFDIRAPHFVMTVRQQLEWRYGPEVLYKAGLQVYTTLDYRYQEIAEGAVKSHIATLQDRNVTNGALVALSPQTGEVLAMVGSRGFFDPDIDGQVNVTMRQRQPGSAIKPLTYLTAFEKGWTPATLIWDVPVEYPDGVNPPYRPQNYDRKFHGPVVVREALGNSYNVPAVKALQFAGLPDMLEMSRRLGITTLTRQDYGLSLTLGGGEVTLLELTSAYGVWANEGKRVPTTMILRVEDHAGRVIEQHATSPGEQVISPQHAYLITHILADNSARQAMFGANSALRLSRPAAAKTGTTDDYRDNWTIGYTPSLVAGVWVGNNDNSEMKNVSGITGAAPIWRQFMESVLTDQPAEEFRRPQGIEEIEVCSASGTRPSDACPERKVELFAAGQGPLGAEHDIHQMVAIDVTTGQLATEFCPPEVVELRSLLVFPPEAIEWGREQNLPLAPTEFCTLHAGEQRLEIFDPRDGQRVSGAVPVFGIVDIPDLDHFVVEYGEGPSPIGWGHVAGPFYSPVMGGMLAMWDTSGLRQMDYSLRVVAHSRHGYSQEARVHVWLEPAQPTVTATMTPTSTPVETPTVSVTLTPTPSMTLTPPPDEATPTPTLVPRPVAVISSPQNNGVVRGMVEIHGSAGGTAFVGYQLAYGPGAEPAQWLTILESSSGVSEGVLGTWDTAGLADGPYTLRLTVVGAPGATETILLRVAVDNTPPSVQVTSPQPDQAFSAGAPVVFAASVQDNIGVTRVEFFLNGGLVATTSSPPFEWTWNNPTPGSHSLQVVVFDLAGNSARSAEISFSVAGT